MLLSYWQPPLPLGDAHWPSVALANALQAWGMSASHQAARRWSLAFSTYCSLAPLICAAANPMVPSSAEKDRQTGRSVLVMVGCFPW